MKLFVMLRWKGNCRTPMFFSCRMLVLFSFVLIMARLRAHLAQSQSGSRGRFLGLFGSSFPCHSCKKKERSRGSHGTLFLGGSTCLIISFISLLADMPARISWMTSWDTQPPQLTNSVQLLAWSYVPCFQPKKCYDTPKREIRCLLPS